MSIVLASQTNTNPSASKNMEDSAFSKKYSARSNKKKLNYLQSILSLSLINKLAKSFQVFANHMISLNMVLFIKLRNLKKRERGIQ